MISYKYLDIEIFLGVLKTFLLTIQNNVMPVSEQCNACIIYLDT
jgi:hypothetical protein